MDNNWKVLVLLLREVAIDKLGVGYQKEIAERTGLYAGNVSRFFSLKYAPRIDLFLIVAKAIKVNFFFEDQENKTELNVMFERAMEQLGKRPDKLPKN